MGRFRIGVGILLVLLAIAIGAQIGMKAVQKPVKQALVEAMAAAELEDYAQAGEKAAEAFTKWRRSRTFCAALCDHEFMEDIEGNLAMLTVWAKEEEKADFCALCAGTILRVEAIENAHRLNISTFF